jgi:hypothetical protein
MISNYFGLPSNPNLAGVKNLIAVFRTVSRLPFGSENIAARIATSPSPRRIAKAAARGAKWREQQAPYLHSFHPPAWTTPVTRLRCPIAKGATFWPTRFGRAYRDAGRSLASLLSIPLPKSPADRVALIDALLEIQALHRNFVAEAGFWQFSWAASCRERKRHFA